MTYQCRFLRMFLEDSRFGPALRLRLASRPSRPDPNGASPRHDQLLFAADTLLETVQIALTANDTFWEEPFLLEFIDPEPTPADVADALTFAVDHLPAKQWLQEWLLTDASAEALTDDTIPHAAVRHTCGTVPSAGLRPQRHLHPRTTRQS